MLCFRVLHQAIRALIGAAAVAVDLHRLQVAPPTIISTLALACSQRRVTQAVTRTRHLVAARRSTASTRACCRSGCSHVSQDLNIRPTAIDFT